MAEVLVEHPPHADGQTALLYERYGTRIYRFCLSRLRSREEAEDAVQSTFLRAHGSLRQGVVPHSESAWLFKIAQNVCVTRAVASSRRTRLEHAADLEQVHERVPDVHRQHDELIGLGDALAEMPPNLRRPFLLREWKGLSYAEIAEDLGVSQSAVETLIFRARRHLAGALDVTGSRLRRAVKALNLGPVLDLMRALLAGGGAKVAAVAAVATVGAVVGVTALPGSNSRSPGAPAQVTPSGGPGAVPQSTTGGSPGATQSSSDPRSSGPGAAARQGNAAGPAWLRGRLTGTSSPTSSAPWTGTPAGVPPAASPTTGAAPSGNSSAPSGPTAGAPSGSNGAPTVPVVAVPPVPLTPPSGSSGLPEVPVPPLPPLPEVPIPQVPSVPPVPVPQVPPVVPPSVPPLPSLTPPPLPVAPPSVPPIPPVPPLPQPPPVPQVVPPPPPVLPPVPPPPPVLPPVPPPPPLP